MEEIDNIKSESAKELPLSADKAENRDTPKNLNESRNPNSPNQINLVADLINNNLMQGFIMSQILESPKAKKQRGNTIWNSRF